MKKKIILFSLIMCVGFQMLNAQGIQVTGTITDEASGEPLPGLNVRISGTVLGTITDSEGTYSLQVPNQNAVLVFSFIGYAPQEIAVDGRTTIDVSMVESLEVLEEVMVTAYGSIRRASFTGSAAVVKTENISRMPLSSVEKALSGYVTGVQVANNSGQPGSPTEIRIRGLGSFSASNQPLFVIDGIPVMSGDMHNGHGGLATGNVMSTIPANDIESITVLKDAAASSLYGSRAANGVILITTKSGREGVTDYKFKASYGFSDFAVDNFKTVNGDDFLMLHRESMENLVASGNAPAGFDIDATMEFEGYVEPEEGFTNWYDHLFRKGVTQNYDLSATGGTEKTNFYISGNIFDQEGVAYKSDLLRYSLRANVTHKAGKMFSVGLNMLNSYTKQNIVDGGTRYYNPFYNVSRNCFPTEGPYLPDGSFRKELQNGYYNVVRERDLNETSAKVFRSMNIGFLEFRPFEFLTLRSTNSIDWITNDETRYASPLSRSGEDENGSVSLTNRKRISTTTSNILTFDKSFNEFHNLNIIGGFEAGEHRATRYDADGEGLPNETIRDIGATAIPVDVYGYDEGSSIMSILSRVNYDFRNKYYGSASYRRDGSSKLGIDERWANFWSVSGAWRLSSESFLMDQSFLDDLKIRASYGTNGTLPNGLYEHLALYSYDDTYDSEVAALESSLGNAALTWEKNANFNVGLDFTLIKRISGSIEYFQRHTIDLLMDVPISMIVGAAGHRAFRNVGEMDNTGWEFDIRTRNITNSNFTWSSTITLTTYKNEIVKLNDNEDIITSRYIRREGEAYNTFYMALWAGVNPANGAPQWYVIDESGDKTVTGDYAEANRTVAGKADPDFYGGVGNEFSYKGFNLSFLINFSVGGKIWYHSGYKSWNDGNKVQYAVQESQLDRWQKPGDVAIHPQRIWGGNMDSDLYSSRFLLDNSYVRLKDITLSYTLPEHISKKIRLNNLTVYAQATNYLTWSQQDICDPEQRVSGYTNFEMPNVKTMMFGLEIGF
jgi:TonB-linked SusC/RagA family outer membrane protein